MGALHQTHTAEYSLYHGDSNEIIRDFPDHSIHYSVFSPAFLDLYIYSDNSRDFGNSKSPEEFWKRFDFLTPELKRVLLPGRLVSIHCADVAAMKERDGYIGLKNFPGDIIAHFEKHGFIFHSRTIIWKDPLIEAMRTYAKGLAHKELVKDSINARSGICDQIITMQAPGENPIPVKHDYCLKEYYGSGTAYVKHVVDMELSATVEERWIDKFYPLQEWDGVEASKNKRSHMIWREYASPVWMDIRQTNTLNKELARTGKEEKHLCPLQLDVIARLTVLYSNPGEIVYSPFAGIGSEQYQPILMGRKAIGSELKYQNYLCAADNCKKAVEEAHKLVLL